MPPIRPSLAYVRVLRPLQWSKNLLVFAALLFSRGAGDAGLVRRAAILFAAFCLTSSALYVFNDILDRGEDSRHPRKRFRPIASGAIHWEIGAIMAPVLAAAGLLTARGVEPGALACLAGYLVLGSAYSLFLKRVVILDVLVIAAGFVLRATAGALAISVAISPWLLICTMLLALFLALAKRRHELLLVPRPSAGRAVLNGYSSGLLDQMISVATSGTLMAYILYAFAEQTSAKFPSRLMPLTVPLVLYGILRYLFLVYRRDEGGEPELLLVTDPPLLISIALYAAAVAVIVSVR
jgi:4-hydroxybenzoate polyprenyltransferase